MTKAELIDQVHGKLDGKLNKKETGAAVQAVFDALSSGIKRDGRIAYPDFGTFTVKTRAARQGRNPATGATIDIPAKTVLKFRIAKAAKDAVL